MQVQTNHEQPPAPAMELAWHYTTGHCASQIIRSGIILPATEGVPLDEQPAVWFSLNQHWEPTATKGITDPLTGKRRDATIKQMMRVAGGCYRFGVDPSRLLDWPTLKANTGIRPLMLYRLEKAASRVRANPCEWMGSLHAVPLRDVVAHQKLLDGSWVHVSTSWAGAATPFLAAEAARNLKWYSAN